MEEPKVPATDQPAEAAYCALWNAEHASSCKRESIMFVGLAVRALDNVTSHTMRNLVNEKIAEVHRKLKLHL